MAYFVCKEILKNAVKKFDEYLKAIYNKNEQAIEIVLLNFIILILTLIKHFRSPEINQV
jgi:hypothetical protein